LDRVGSQQLPGATPRASIYLVIAGFYSLLAIYVVVVCYFDLYLCTKCPI